MRREITHKSATLAAASDLTVVAPIRKGLVPSLDAMTYKTRVKRVLQGLHVGRRTSHEYDFVRALSDVVERAGRIHSVRFAIVNGDHVLLSVAFDGPWESYIRAIWQKAARSLDLIFCNTEEYVTGWDHSFEQWLVWVRKFHQEAPFFYSPAGLTYQDTVYLRAYEGRMRRATEVGTADAETTRIRVHAAEEIADRLRKRGTDPSNLGMDEPLDLSVASRPAFRQGLRGLATLYRLTEAYLPGTQDGAILHRAATELLREFVLMTTSDASDEYQSAIEFAQVRFKDALAWLRDTPSEDRKVPALPERADESEIGDVQGGIVHSYPGVSDGCLMLLSFESPAALGGFLEALPVTDGTAQLGQDEIAFNVAVTLEGLRLAGMTDDEIATLPEEFAQGMEKRAGMLGDVRINHPRRWRLPPLNAADGIDAVDVAETDPRPRADLASVHLLVQLRLCHSTRETPAARAALWQRWTELAAGHESMQLLSIQWMQSLKSETGVEREHFGFVHTDFAPVFHAADKGRKYPNQVHLGEVLLGHDNAADFAKPAESRSPMEAFLRNGSFLVVRKLRQDVQALEQVLQVAVDEACPPARDRMGQQQRADYRSLLLAKMMGRWPLSGGGDAGLPLANATPGAVDDFTYMGDRDGAVCPFHAHVRRANPRDVSGAIFGPPGARVPRIVRRGMAYGPLHTSAEDQSAQGPAERGLVFMAYNASIGEQFEVIQGWLTGSNSSGSYSGQVDPFLGVAEAGRPRYFRFEHEGKVIRMRLDGSDRSDEEPRPFVRLEWGAYLFAPSLSTIRKLADRAHESAGRLVKSWSVEKGVAEIARLRTLEHEAGSEAAKAGWKTVLEDPNFASDFTAASVWAAIREQHGGVLQTPFGVVVASARLVNEVLRDREEHLSVSGYLQRMERSYGGVFLGMDPHRSLGAYERESADANPAIMALTGSRSQMELEVADATSVTLKAADALARLAMEQSAEEQEACWETVFDPREITDTVLAHFCEKWFGLSERGGHFQRSGVRWTWQPGERPCYPGHFMSSARYIFQPHPGPEVERLGSQHGSTARAAMESYLAEFGDSLQAPIARALLDAEPARTDPTYAARSLCGLVMGLAGPIEANLRRVLDEWLKEGTLWQLRNLFLAGAQPEEVLAREVRRKFTSAMQLRASPDVLWRTAVTGHAIGDPGPHRVHVQPGEHVVVSLVSATQENLERGDPGLDEAFGGRRRLDGDHPAHACPGAGPAMAIMLGFFNGLVKCPHALRAGPGPGTLSMEGHRRTTTGRP